MSASIIIERWTHWPGLVIRSDITNSNTVAVAADEHQSDANTALNPIRIPSSGEHHSFWVSTTLNVTAAPAGRLNNFRWYTDGTNNFGTGVTCKAGWTQSYVRATGTIGVSGSLANLDPTIGPFLSSTGLWNNAFIRTEASPLVINSGMVVTGVGPLPVFVIIQVSISSTASPGIFSQENFTWVVDET